MSHGWYQRPNDWPRHLAKQGLRGSERDVLDIIERETWGWRVERVRITVAELMTLTGHTKKVIRTALRSLTSAGLLHRHAQGTHRGAKSELSLNWPPPPNTPKGSSRTARPDEKGIPEGPLSDQEKGVAPGTLSHEKGDTGGHRKGTLQAPTKGSLQAPLSPPSEPSGKSLSEGSKDKERHKDSTPLTPQEGGGGKILFDSWLQKLLTRLAPSKMSRAPRYVQKRKQDFLDLPLPPHKLQQAIREAFARVQEEMETGSLGRCCPLKRLFDLADQALSVDCWGAA